MRAGHRPRVRPTVATVALLWLVAVSAASLWLRARTPLHVIADAANDDLLFVRLAGYLDDGQWLGPYDGLTLVKGPGYPLFIGVSHRVGLPLKMAEQALHLLAAGLLSVGLARLGRSQALGVLVFTLVALNPVYLSTEAARVNRNGVYASMCLAIVGTLLVVASLAADRRRRALPAVVAALAAGALLGVLAAGYWVTREERVWLAPTLLVLVAGLFMVALLGPAQRPKADLGGAGLLLALPVVVAVGVLVAGLGQVQAWNERSYAYPEVTEMADGAFPRLYAALTAIEAGPTRTFVPVSAAQRRAAYDASPTFGLLRANLENPDNFWFGPGCQAVSVCDDYVAGWLPWALFGAVHDVSGTDSPVPAQRLMGEAAREIEAGCGRVYPCRRQLTTFVPPVEAIPASGFIASLRAAVRDLVAFDLPASPATPGSPADWESFAAVVAEVPSTPAEIGQERPAPVGDALRFAYGGLLALAAVPALVGLCWWRVSRRVRLLQVAGWVLLTMAATRMGMIALVDATSFPAVSTGYLLPAFDPAIAGVAVGCACLAAGVRRRRVVRGQRVPTSSAGRLG